MKPLKIKIISIVAAMFALASATSVRAQAVTTASQLLQLSVFAGADGTYTGIANGKNLGITAGVDVGLRRFLWVTPSIEVRGTKPIHDGSVDAQENVLGGLKISKHYLALHPYLDLLYGRGKITYEGAGLLSPDGQYYYIQSPSNVLSPGAGVDVSLSSNFALKADAQYQRYDTPVTQSGHLYAKALTLGLVYRLDFNSYHRHKQ